MTTHFIAAEIDLQDSPGQLHQEVESELQKRGNPLRWAVTAVDEDQHKAHVEAIVTSTSPLNQAAAVSSGSPASE